MLITFGHTRHTTDCICRHKSIQWCSILSVWKSDVYEKFVQKCTLSTRLFLAPSPAVLLQGIYRVARTMFETDGLPHDMAERCNNMDEIWVPTEFNVHSFVAAGEAGGSKMYAIYRGGQEARQGGKIVFREISGRDQDRS